MAGTRTRTKQLAFFAVPDAAEYFIRDRERQMLSWCFFRGSYGGTAAISKPGFLRAIFGPFAARTVHRDAQFFNQTVEQSKLGMPVLALDGEASMGPKVMVEQLWAPAESNLTAEVVPKARHWLGDENPVWVGNRLLQFFGGDASGVPSVDVPCLDGKVTLTIGG
ncbi:hypothetical protein H2203_007259 [Taxawa tesnikishii (nom. ined.)]|nr:hypothetical protein H2203_007259 [Dothideales sp. JES 119]